MGTVSGKPGGRLLTKMTVGEMGKNPDKRLYANPLEPAIAKVLTQLELGFKKKEARMAIEGQAKDAYEQLAMMAAANIFAAADSDIKDMSELKQMLFPDEDVKVDAGDINHEVLKKAAQNKDTFPRLNHALDLFFDNDSIKAPNMLTAPQKRQNSPSQFHEELSKAGFAEANAIEAEKRRV